MSFLDAYLGYNQIPMNPEDRIHTAFITEKGLFCYRVMSFGLKNTGATYQCLMNKMFTKQLGRIIEVYIDDMVIKSKEADQHLRDINECFKILRYYKMRLNPAKCAFGVSSGQFLGHIVTKCGIEATPMQLESISSLDTPKSMRIVQRLTGKIAALSRFILRMSDRCEPFFKSIKNNTSSLWGPKQEKAFIELKQYLSSPPILSSPLPGEDLFMYLAVSEVAMSAVLFREENKEQRPVFFVNRMLLDAETHYSAVENMVLALGNAKKKLRHYFDTHPIMVITDFPIKQILSKPDLSGMLTKWAIDLGIYDIHYVPRAAKKGQVMADFLVEIYSFSAEPE